MFPFALQEVIRFCEGEHLFVAAVCRAWREEYGRQFEPYTYIENVNTFERRQMVARSFTLMKSLSSFEPHKAFYLLPQAKRYLQPAEWMTLTERSLMHHVEDVDRCREICRLLEFDKVRELFVLCLKICIVSGSAESVNFFAAKLMYLTDGERMCILMQCALCGQDNIYKAILGRLIPFSYARKWAQRANHEPLLQQVEELELIDLAKTVYFRLQFIVVLFAFITLFIL